jgi:hypothetical protein
MRFYSHQHPFYCGIDLPARTMDVCRMRHDGDILLHRNMTAAPEPFLKAGAPYRDGLAVAVECLCHWYWLADLCAAEGIPFVLGHALSLKAMHGGQAKNDTAIPKRLRGYCVAVGSSRPLNTMTLRPCICYQPCPALAQSSASCCSMQCMPSRVSPGDRIASPLAVESHGPRNRRANAWALPVRKAGTPTSRGPCLKPPRCACAPIRQGQNISPAWRKSLTKAKPCLSWHLHWLGPSIPCSSATRPLLCTSFSMVRGAEQVSPAPHWPRRG